ncbi:MAG: lipocalin family protein [Bacteroidales bacterium]
MKKLSIIGAVIFSTLILFSCSTKNSFVVGKWKIDGVGTMDTASSKNNLLAFGLLSMMSKDVEFEFSENGTFQISNQNKSTVSGTYTISDDSKSLTLKANNTEEGYEIIKNDGKQLQLKSVKDASVINLNKE